MRNYLLAAALLLSSCANAADVREDYSAQMSARSFSPQVIDAGSFKIFSLQKITDSTKPVRVYIEGDGKGFLANGMISPDPTPSNFVLNLIKQDNYPNIIYLARPCQYGVQDNCAEKYWTTSRFAAEVILAYSKIISRYENVELVGYSGGGAIAMMLTASNSNIINIRTVAGNIDHNAFNKFHETPALTGSINPVISSIIPQVHFVGSEDKIVPISVARSYEQQQQPNTCTAIVTVNGATHSENWHEKWADLIKTSPFCREHHGVI